MPVERKPISKVQIAAVLLILLSLYWMFGRGNAEQETAQYTAPSQQQRDPNERIDCLESRLARGDTPSFYDQFMTGGTPC
jgi:hypothetical protein